MSNPLGRPRGDDEARFWAKVNRADDDSCWIWTGALTAGGYGRFRLPDGHVMAHRWAYARYVKPIPVGLTLDHILANGCTSRACVNYLRHLEPVTMRENTLRGSGPSARNAGKEVCDSGHLLTSANVYVTPEGGRQCRACRRAIQGRYRERQLAALMGGVAV